MSAHRAFVRTPASGPLTQEVQGGTQESVLPTRSQFPGEAAAVTWGIPLGKPLLSRISHDLDLSVSHNQSHWDALAGSGLPRCVPLGCARDRLALRPTGGADRPRRGPQVSVSTCTGAECPAAGRRTADAGGAPAACRPARTDLCTQYL